uniref:Uncharacterized protein n=1 Tax=Candidatus Kentrum sp. DK TaxID=2126562 RepID=A0A450RVG1_9GAMM|nr:MAG: hypothetical protein BECKDK2373C_GA0170839_10042 [Candidatus Kentron sp. DK]VFJ67762.1 MAG: hypothetical protein BECKDK2373B_GA0170837_11975 [Candidatus Kentron sp. DK]
MRSTIESPISKKLRKAILNTLGSAGNLTLSTQVLQEFFVAVTRKLTPPLSSETAYALARLRLRPAKHDSVLVK